jgi:hypothetical protein
MAVVAAGRIRLIKKAKDFIENRTRDFPACTIVPQRNALRRVDIAYTYEHNSRVRIDTHLSDNFPIQNGLKKMLYCH